ncbi:SphA family protein [Aquabacterium sp.]|uniref:SphA family protein n=1 Tax=Aquabacterium sp. TaxID=1872578 RepID=UPI002C3C2817|nr:transporter [Aquabacterium sp.]HSW07297.1 transporter [Aquabacterium sp.]
MSRHSLQSPWIHGAVLGLLAAAGAAQAVENGAPITPFGVFDFGSGMLPPPTEVATVGLRTAFYRASQLRDDAGQRSPVGLKLKVDSIGVALVKMTDISVLGGKYGAYAVLPYLNMSNRLSIPTPVGPLNLAGSDSAQGDIQIAPLVLQWTPSPGLFANAALQLQLPTGSYDKNRLITAGTNHWTITPNAAVTYILPSGFELSSTFQLNFNGRNKDTDYRSGVEYQQEFALGQHVGPWTFGVGGYVYQQLTDDKRAGQDIGNRSRVMALGPVINFFELGSGWPLVWVHAYKEFNARNRAQGTHAALRAAWSF